ncbi:hypothetical protein CQW23_19088 [Capsicum baccatum]|uniref:Leucine-rich repeat-containing N-terminal plant-type domain-containing protein n=1 Tax=Capsicum baccatum TaxID=33114 RepID=A0A2G2W4U2_CAPBA|nr:hypothetical protein CQW23_19088 [Capsicum baccatum]
MFTFNPNVSGDCYNPATLSWNKSKDCCSWDGVYCEELTGQVIELSLACSGLPGKFHTNSFTSIIPAKISHLSKLQALRIWTVDPYGLRLGPYNFELLLKNLTQLSAELREALPERVFDLSNLENLSLSSNSQTGQINTLYIILRSPHVDVTSRIPG